MVEEVVGVGIAHGTVVAEAALPAVAGELLGRLGTSSTVGTQTDILVVAVGGDDVACRELIAETRCSGAHLATDGEACGMGGGIGNRREVLRIDSAPGLARIATLHGDALRCRAVGVGLAEVAEGGRTISAGGGRHHGLLLAIVEGEAVLGRALQVVGRSTAVEQGVDGVGRADAGFPHLCALLLQQPATQAAVEGAVIGGQLAHGLHGGGVDDDLMIGRREAAACVVEEGAMSGRGGQVLLHGVEVETGIFVATGAFEDDGGHGTFVVAHAGNRAFQVVQEIADVGLLAFRELNTGTLGDIDVVEVHERTRLDGGALGLSLLHLLHTLGIGLSHKPYAAGEEAVELCHGLLRQQGKVIGEGAQVGQFDAYEACHQLAAAHAGEPSEAAVGFLALAQFLQRGIYAAVEEVLVEEVDELCAALAVLVGLAQPRCFIEDELLQVFLVGKGTLGHALLLPQPDDGLQTRRSAGDVGGEDVAVEDRGEREDIVVLRLAQGGQCLHDIPDGMRGVFHCQAALRRRGVVLIK